MLTVSAKSKVVSKNLLEPVKTDHIRTSNFMIMKTHNSACGMGDNLTQDCLSTGL